MSLRARQNGGGSVRKGGGRGNGNGSPAGRGNNSSGGSLTNALLHFNGTDGSTTFTDEYSNTWVRPVGTPTAEIKTGSHSTPKFGTASLRNGVIGAGNDGGILMTNAGIGNLAAEDFTIDFWVYDTSNYGPDNSTSPYLWWHSVNPPGHANPIPGIAIQQFNFSQIGVLISYNGTAFVGGTYVIQSSTLVYQLNTWHHVAVTRSGANLRLFYDGVQRGSTYNIGSNSLYAASGVNLGGVYDGTAGNFSSRCNFDEVRIIKGSAAWTANFTPPTSAYSPP